MMAPSCVADGIALCLALCLALYAVMLRGLVLLLLAFVVKLLRGKHGKHAGAGGFHAIEILALI